MSKKLSILIPAYNVEKYIRHNMDTILQIPESQKNKIEVIVIDDGSFDKTAEILDDYAQNYPYIIKVISKNNGGISEARNLGIENACGEYIWFVDADDYIEVNNISKMMDILERGESDYHVFAANRINEKNKVIGEFGLECDAHRYEKIRFSYMFIEKCLDMHMPWLRIYRNNIIGNIRFPVGVTHEDIHFDLSILIKEPVISFHDLVIYNHYFDNPESTTNTMSASRQLDVLWVYTDLIEYMSSLDCDRVMANEMKKICLHGMLKRLMYVLTLDYDVNNKKDLYNKYAEQIRKRIDIYDQVDISDRLSSIEKIFIQSVKIDSFLISLCLASLRRML